MIIPCYTAEDAEPIIGSTCLRYVSVTDRHYISELELLKEKIERLENERVLERQEKEESEAYRMDEEKDMFDDKPGTSKMI